MKNLRTLLPFVAVLVALLAVSCKKENNDPVIEKNYAELVNGETFKNAIPVEANAINFVYGSSDSSDVLLSTEESAYPIYGVLKDTAWCICTPADNIYANPDCSKMFYGLTRIEYIRLGEGFNTQNVTNMSQMFGCLWRVSTIDLSMFNTENVTDMSKMFMLSGALTSLDLSSFNAANVTDMSSMFLDCNGLTTLDLSDINAQKVTTLKSMLYGCYGLTSVDLSGISTYLVTDCSDMFRDCSALTYIDLTNFSTPRVTNTSNMFNGCTRLDGLLLVNFNMDAVESKTNMFHNIAIEPGSITINCTRYAQPALEEGTNIPASIDVIWAVL